jgi:hypothetical protein
VSGWQKCDTCRKVRQGTEFDPGATTCRDCLAGPAPSTRKKAAPVTTLRRATPRPEPVSPAGPPRPRLGSVGSGDLEVRERRARRTAQDALAELHPEEFRQLLRDARAAEGLRPSDSGPPPPAPEAG